MCNKIIALLQLTVIVIVLFSCKRIEYFPDNPLTITNTVVLSHKGNGSNVNGNSLAACIEGLKVMKGIECDLQISANRTLWLSHSPLIRNCVSYNNLCFSETTDQTIQAVDTCISNDKDYTRLEEVFEYMFRVCPEKTISLDVKAWEPCSAQGMNIIAEMNILAQRIIDLHNKYPLTGKVLVESETGDFLYYMKTHSTKIETYLSVNGDFELGVSRALNAGFTGISFKYNFLEKITKDHIDLIHRKGLKIQLWTIDNATEMQKILDMKPDYVQTDSLGWGL